MNDIIITDLASNSKRLAAFSRSSSVISYFAERTALKPLQNVFKPDVATMTPTIVKKMVIKTDANVNMTIGMPAKNMADNILKIITTEPIRYM